jgi:hypothetical protein
VPARDKSTMHTSGLAVTSLVLALIGAFTLLGTMAAAVLGAVALRAIRRERDRLGGERFAWAAIILGVALTAISLFAYTKVELFGVDELLHESQWAGKLDYDAPLEISRPSDGYRIKRPSKEWGIVRNRPAEFVDAFHTPQGLVLVKVRESALIACVPLRIIGNPTLTECRKQALEEFADLDLSSPGRKRSGLRAKVVPTGEVKELPHGDTEGFEIVVEKSVRGQTKKYLLRVVRRPDDDYMYLVAGGVRADRFAGLEPEFREALGSFQVLNRTEPAGFR